MDIEDKELFDSALTDAAPEIDTSAEQPEAVTGQPRDEHGRFAARAEAEPEAQSNPPQAEIAPARDEAHVPSWRLREEREAREAAERRFQEFQAQTQREMEELRRRQPAAEPTPAQDIFENPNEFVGHNVRQAVDPIKSEISQMREFFSRRDAEREHGSEKVKAAYDWIAQGMASRDPDAASTLQRAMQSQHPFGEIVQAFQQRQVFQQIGNDPQKWFETSLEQKLQSDPQFAASLLQKIQSSARVSPQGQRQSIQLPPSLNRTASAAPMGDDGDDDSDAGLLKSALRR